MGQPCKSSPTPKNRRSSYGSVCFFRLSQSNRLSFDSGAACCEQELFDHLNFKSGEFAPFREATVMELAWQAAFEADHSGKACSALGPPASSWVLT